MRLDLSAFLEYMWDCATGVKNIQKPTVESYRLLHSIAARSSHCVRDLLKECVLLLFQGLL